MDLIFPKLVLLSTLIFPYSNASNSQLRHYKGPILSMCGAHPFKLIATWLIPDRAIKGISQKGLKNNQGWEKPAFIKKTTHLFFYPIIFIFWIETVFCYFCTKNTKTSFWIIFIAWCNITIFRITQ